VVHAVTESEITRGLLDSSVNSASTTLCIIRNIVDIKNQIGQNPRASKFIDVTNCSFSSTKELDADAESLLNDLREVKVKSRLPPENLTCFELDWQSVVVDDTAVTKSGTTSTTSTAVGRHQEYIESFCTEFYDSVTRLIAAGCSGNRPLVGKVAANAGVVIKAEVGDFERLLIYSSC
jgi:hypothetical protein